MPSQPSLGKKSAAAGGEFDGRIGPAPHASWLSRQGIWRRSDQGTLTSSTGRLRVVSLLNKLILGGHEQRLLQFAKAVDRRRFDHRVVVLTAPQFSDETQERASGSMRHEFEELGFPVHDLGERPDLEAGRVGLRRAARSAAGMSRVIRRLVRYLREERIDVVEAHHTSAIFAAAIAGRLTGIPIAISTYHLEPWKPLVMRLPGQLAFGLSGSVITDSRVRAAEIQQWLWRKSMQVDVIPTGVPVPLPIRPAAEVREELKLPLDPAVRIVGQLSGRIPIKGHDVLLEAAAQVLRHEPQTIFLCVGFSRGALGYEAELERRVHELGLSDRFVFRAYPGPIGDVWQLFNVFAHPSKFDSLPLSVLEGMALGTPAVMTSVGGIPEVITHEQNGLLVSPNDAAALAAALLRLLRDPQLSQRLGDAAQQYHRQNLTPEVMTRCLEEVYSRLHVTRGR